MGDAGRHGVGGCLALSRRNRVLAHLQPILDIERDKNLAARAGGADRDWDVYDTRLLVIAALDAVASESGLHLDGGVPRDHVLAAISDEARRCAPNREREEHDEVAAWILDRLLNTEAASRGFSVPFVDPASGYERRDLSVTVLYEQVGGDGESIFVYAADAAINLVLVTIDFELEDAQVAADAVLRVQLDSGRWDDAVETAEKALRLSRSYREQLNARLAAVRRDLRDVDWEGAVEPVLARANTHIGERIRAEQALLEHAFRSSSGDADSDVRREAGTVVRMLKDALETMSQLLRVVITARDTFRKAQAEQAFRPPAPLGSVDMEEDVLRPLASSAAEETAAHVQRLLGAFAAPRCPTLPSLSRMLDVLLERPRESDDEPVVVEAAELAEIEATFCRFADEDWNQARDRFSGVDGNPVRLSDLLDGLPHDPAALVALLALRAYSPDGHPVRADDILEGVSAVSDGKYLDHPTLMGDDLVVHRDVTAAAEAGVGRRSRERRRRS